MINYLIAHVIADFYVQSETLAKYKRRSPYGVLIHCIHYAIGFLVIYCLHDMLGTEVRDEVSFLLFAIGAHALVDFGKFTLFDKQSAPPLSAEALNDLKKEFWVKPFAKLIKRDASTNALKPRHDLILFMLDQAIHVSLLIYFARIFPLGDHQSIVSVVVLIALILGKPANILIRLLIKPFDPKEIDQEELGFKGAGERIGTLERLLMMAILVMSQGNFTGIAIVLTLKTIARYAKISNNAKFAEYFVIGSLTSLLIVICVYVVLYSISLNI